MRKTNLNLGFILALLFALGYANAQTNHLRINSNIVLPKDTIETRNLTTALNDFLLAAQRPNEENRFVFDAEKLQTFVQLDELKGIGKSGTYNDDNFYKPYLINVVPLKDKKYLLQMSFIGIHQNMALLRASFQFIAHRTDNAFTFSSPLLRNTKDWKVKKVGNNIFHYRNTINNQKIKEFNKLASLFDSKLMVRNKTVDYYY
jgi:hypothetical protein